MTQAIPTEKYKNKKLWSRLRKAQYEFIKEILEQTTSHGTLLDVGSGASPFEDLYSGYKKTSIDFAPYQGTNIIHDLENGLPLGNNLFDIVVSTNTFEHIYTSKNLIKECFRVTKNAGFLVGSTPFQLCVHQEPHDYFRYTSFALERMLLEAGYTSVNVVPLCTHNQLLGQTIDHFYSSLKESEGGVKGLKPYILKVFWKLSRLILSATGMVFGELPPSKKHTLGYGFSAKKP